MLVTLVQVWHAAQARQALIILVLFPFPGEAAVYWSSNRLLPLARARVSVVLSHSIWRSPRPNLIFFYFPLPVLFVTVSPREAIPRCSCLRFH